MANRLAGETSPYLLQHANNPVDWYPWGEEALERARHEDRPILLSIGYSACHWCHVMERESFENPAIAQLMNNHFVNIKVDREERPDLDSVYMTAVQGMTGQGGWPMTVFLTPDGTPFHAGTYFPPADRGGMPGFPRILDAVATAYRDRRQEILAQGPKMRDYLQRNARLDGGETGLDAVLLDAAFSGLRSAFDERNGGFGGAPKFPQPMALEFLLRTHLRTGDQRALEIVEVTLRKMASGGMYDQLGGGFHRYSVDERWLVPHFEKMLYDNAQLAALYLHAYQATGQDLYQRVCVETLEYALREMTAPEGGFYSTQDADSEGHEGKFFVWTPAEITANLPEVDARVFLSYYGVLLGANFEGKSILFVPQDEAEVAVQLDMPLVTLRASLARSRASLFALRCTRVPPGLDDKVVTAWNGLLLAAMAEAGAALGRTDFLKAAARNADFVLTTLRGDRGLLRTYRHGQAKIPAFLEDFSAYTVGLLSLYRATLEVRWLRAAASLADAMIARFWDETAQAFFDTAQDAEPLVSRPRDVFDNATPSGNSLAVEALLALAVLLDRSDYRAIAERALRSLAEPMARMPTGFGRLLCSLDTVLAPGQEVALIGEPDAPDMAALREVLYRSYRPNTLLAQASGPGDDHVKDIPLLAERRALNARATAYVCRNYACELPTSDPLELERQLARAPTA